MVEIPDSNNEDDGHQGFFEEVGKDAVRAALIAVVSVLVSALSEVITHRRQDRNDHFDDY